MYHSDTIADILSELPSAERTGEWIDGEAHHKYKEGVVKEIRACSLCGAAYIRRYDTDDYDIKPPNYCPNCGADMRGEGYGR